MSYEIERKVITNYLQTQSFYGMSPFGLDGEASNMAAGAGFMTLLSGRAAQRSIGAPGANLHDYVGVLAITIITEGGKGSTAGRVTADLIVADLTGRKLDETGGAPSVSSAVVIDFAREGLAPYLSSSRPEAPNHRTVVHAPFVRTERK